MKRTLIDQPTSAPTRKLTATVIGGGIAATVIGLAVWAGAPAPPPGLEGGLTVVAGALVGYYTRNRT